jgi:hypothetical protein
MRQKSVLYKSFHENKVHIYVHNFNVSPSEAKAVKRK